MNYIAYTARFLYRIKWWLILCPLLVALLVYLKMGTKPRNYKSTTTIYTGIVSGYDITTTEGSRQDWNVINNAMDNLINIILSQSTLKNVSLRLYAQGLTHLDPDNDNQYLSARTSRYLLSKTPPDVMELVDHTSEKNTYENLRKYEEIDHNNHVYGMFHWSPPYYSYQALSQIKVKRLANSDMLEISYENDDPYIVYNTLIILNDEFVKQYRDLRFGETNNVIAYFESKLERVGNNLRNLEDSLRDYNVQHRVINYDEQTKHIAALSRDYELRYEEILLNFESAEKLRASIEGQLEGLQETFRNNAEFIEKLHKIGSIYSRLSAAEAFQPETDGTEGISDRTAMPASRNDTGQLRRKLSEETRSLQELTTNIANQQYTKEGLSANSIVTEWLATVLLAEKSRAELAVMKLRKQELDQKYTQFSPVGSTLKRKGREINFSEQSYLSILTALNTARLRQKNLQMTSATLKIINAPVLPLEAEPSKRKMMVAAAGLATLLFVLGFFILLELLDRTLRDKVRAERITKGRVIGDLSRQSLSRAAAVYQAIPRDRIPLHRQCGSQLFRPGQTAQRTQYPEHRARGRKEPDRRTLGGILPRSEYESPHRIVEQGFRHRTQRVPAGRETRGFRARHPGRSSPRRGRRSAGGIPALRHELRPEGVAAPCGAEHRHRPGEPHVERHRPATFREGRKTLGTHPRRPLPQLCGARRGANLHGPDAPLQPSSQAGVSDQPVRIHGRQINCGTSWNTTAA